MSLWSGKKVGDKVQLLDPIVKLFTADTPIHLDRDGLENLVNLAADNVGALWLFDSYSKFTAPLGLQELVPKLVTQCKT